MMVEVIMVDEVLDVIEQEVSAKLARDARAGGASEATVALIAELCAEQLAINRQHHLERCAQAIERQLPVLH